MKYILPAGTIVDVVIHGTSGWFGHVEGIMTDLNIVIEKYDIFSINKKNQYHTYIHFKDATYILYYKEKDLIIR